MDESALAEASALLEKYLETEGHHAFHLKKRSPWFPWIWVKGQWYEGYITEVKENTIVFGWAPGPLDYTLSWKDWELDEFEIPIRDIDLTTLAW